MPNNRNLTSPEVLILNEFMNSLDTSESTKDQLMYTFKNFVYEVGLENINNQTKIDAWVNAHEYGKPNNNIRYFLMKFSYYLDIPTAMTGWKVKKLPENINPVVFSKDEKDFIIKASVSLDSKYCSGELFSYYLRLLDIAALRKSTPLSIIYNDITYNDGLPSIKITGKGKKQRYAIIDSDLYMDIIDYCERNRINGNDIIFDFNIDQLQTMYNQVCRIAKIRDMKIKGYMKTVNEARTPNERKKKLIEAYERHKGYSIRQDYTCNENGKLRKKTRWIPVYSLHKFRRYRIQYWYKVEKVSLVEIMNRAGHSSVDVTKIYIDEGRNIYLQNWNDSLNNEADKEMIEKIENYRKERELHEIQ